MHPGTSLGEKFADRRVLPKRRQQLDLSFAHLQKSRREPVLLVAGTVRERSAKKRGVKLDRRLELGNGNTDMVKPRRPARRGGRRQSRRVGRLILERPLNTDTTLL